jgi:hypothetical protein
LAFLTTASASNARNPFLCDAYAVKKHCNVIAKTSRA